VDKALSFEKECVNDENKIHVKYARVNEDGTRYVPEGKPASYFEIAEESEEKHNEEMLALYEEAIEIDKNKILVSELDNTGLTPAQMVALEPLIDMEDKNVLQMVNGTKDTKTEIGPSPQPQA
jgi:hypothetical protein